MDAALDLRWMRRALRLAAQGQGHVEPNPLVGCVVAQGETLVGEGFHPRFGGPHAEIVALEQAKEAARGATLYVTLEPCCHHGKTPPCVDAVIAAGVARVVAAMTDPFPQVRGGGVARLREAGVEVETGLCEQEARWLVAPYLKLLSTGRPWVIGKWAMTLDGKIATSTGHSRWISGEASRQIVHQLRGRVDAVMVGRGTALADDPLLTARPPGPRAPTRIVVDSGAALSLESQLVRTVEQAPVLVAVGPRAPAQKREQLRDAGCEVLSLEGQDAQRRLESLLDELGRRRMTNVLVEGGGQLLGGLFDLKEIDETHVFVACKLAGGEQAKTPIRGRGVLEMTGALQLDRPSVEVVDEDVYIRGRVRK